MTHKLLPIRARDLSVGRHLILDAWQAPVELLDDPEHVRRALKQAVEASGATLINLCVHQFSPYGVTATATLAESHMAVHTWPEYGYLGADIFFCGSGDPQRAIDSLVESFDAGETRVRELKRGIAAVRIVEAVDEQVESA